MYCLGIDTSNYTTSLALMDSRGELVWEKRRLLKVTGKHGLRQGEAVFQHLQNLPEIFAIKEPLAAIGVSVRPRDVQGSYMPVFTVGTNFARVLAQALAVPLVPCSHQHNHLAAGFWSAGWWPVGEQVLAVHLSGGTSEILAVTWDKRPSVKVLGATRDLNAGQFVDRVGVALGLGFPAGPQLEKLAAAAQGEVRLASPVAGMDMSFSGPLSAALRLVGQVEPAELARGVEDCIAKGVEKALLAAAEVTGCRRVLLVGGVMANARIRHRLSHRLRRFSLYFASPQASRDNAIGCAILAREHVLN